MTHIHRRPDTNRDLFVPCQAKTHESLANLGEGRAPDGVDSRPTNHLLSTFRMTEQARKPLGDTGDWYSLVTAAITVF